MLGLGNEIPKQNNQVFGDGLDPNLLLFFDFAPGLSYGSGVTTDLTSNGNNFTTVGTPTHNGSDGGGCIELEKAGDYLEFSSGLGTFDLQEYTIIVWFKPNVVSGTSGIWSYDFTSHASPTYYAQHIRQGNSSMFNYFNRNGSWSSSGRTDTLSPAVAGQWMQWAVTMDSQAELDLGTIYYGDYRVFKNGAQRGGTVNYTSPFTVSYYDQEVWIGRINFDDSPDIKVGLVKVYSRRLSPAEVLQDFEDNRSRFGI